MKKDKYKISSETAIGIANTIEQIVEEKIKNIKIHAKHLEMDIISFRKMMEKDEGFSEDIKGRYDRHFNIEKTKTK